MSFRHPVVLRWADLDLLGHVNNVRAMELLQEVRVRVAAQDGVLARDAVRVFWVNPVADLRVMNLLLDGLATMDTYTLLSNY